MKHTLIVLENYFKLCLTLILETLLAFLKVELYKFSSVKNIKSVFDGDYSKCLHCF